MKETKSSFTTEKPLDYTASKDAYDGNLNAANRSESSADSKQRAESGNESKTLLE